MGYLLPAEYAEYGLPEGTTDDWVAMASALMESYCRRVSLMATEYVERMRLTAGSQAVRLSCARSRIQPSRRYSSQEKA